jgi:rhodanese-related sulfurtransferase
MKLLFDAESGQVLGAQAVGEAGVERRIDVIATVIQMRGTVYDLEEAELCYAPQFGAAKDPVNMAGMIAANVMRGDAQVASWEEYDPEAVYLVDVRSRQEYEEGHVEGARNIDVNSLRQRSDEIPRDKPVWVYCEVGQRGYYAQRLLVQRGLQAVNVLGGMKSYRNSRDQPG